MDDSLQRLSYAKRQVECPIAAYLRPDDKDFIEKIFPCTWNIYYTIQIGTHNIAKSFGQFG